jgi:hypothetical protein
MPIAKANKKLKLIKPIILKMSKFRQDIVNNEPVIEESKHEMKIEEKKGDPESPKLKKLSKTVNEIHTNFTGNMEEMTMKDLLPYRKDPPVSDGNLIITLDLKTSILELSDAENE